MNAIYCLDCQLERPHSRGLCERCYKRNSRNGSLDMYPIQGFLDKPERFIHWAFEYQREMLWNVGVEYNAVPVNLDEYIEFTKWKESRSGEQS